MVTTTASEENGDFCVAVAPATRTAGTLTQLVKGTGCLLSRPSGRSGSYTGLIAFNHRRLKELKGNVLPRNGTICLCEIFFFFCHRYQSTRLHTLTREMYKSWRWNYSISSAQSDCQTSDIAVKYHYLKSKHCVISVTLFAVLVQTFFSARKSLRGHAKISKTSSYLKFIKCRLAHKCR